MKRRWFTLIEIVLVMLIVSILLFAFRNIFQIKNKEIVYAQTCVENIYGQINNFAKWAIRSETILSGTASGTLSIYPDRYLIYMLPSQNTIRLTYYTTTSGSAIYQEYQLTGNIPNQRNCKSNAYDIILSGTDSVLTINKWLSTNAQHQSFRLSWAGQFSLTTDVMLYINGALTGKNIAQFQIDTRTEALQKRICLNINTNGNCEEWDK